MSVKPKPKLLKCSQCRWNRLFAPKSDVISVADIPACCPKCGSELVVAESPSPIKLLGEIFK